MLKRIRRFHMHACKRPLKIKIKYGFHSSPSSCNKEKETKIIVVKETKINQHLLISSHESIAHYEDHVYVKFIDLALRLEPYIKLFLNTFPTGLLAIAFL